MSGGPARPHRAKIVRMKLISPKTTSFAFACACVAETTSNPRCYSSLSFTLLALIFLTNLTTSGGISFKSVDEPRPSYFFGCADGGRIPFSRRYMAAAA